MRVLVKNAVILAGLILFDGQAAALDLAQHIQGHSDIPETLVSEISPGERMCGGEAGFDGLPFIGYLDTDEEGENVVCKYPHDKQDWKSRRRTARDSFWMMNLSGIKFLGWLYDNASYRQDKKSKKEVFKFTYQQMVGKQSKEEVSPGEESLNVMSSDALTYFCAVFDSDKMTLAVGYPLTADDAGEECILSTKLKLSTVPVSEKVTHFVVTEHKGWCYKELTKGVCKVKKDHSNIPAEQCEQEARDLGVGYCRDTAGACCFLNDQRRINTKDTDDGKNTCYLPEGIHEKSMLAKCGITDAMITFGEQVSETFANAEDSFKDLFD